MYPTSRQFNNVIDGGGDVPDAPKIKVSQATVDAVKNDGRGNLGVAAANKVAYGSPGYNGSTFSPNAPVSAEYKEGTKRVYPNAKATSLSASSGATNPKQAGPKKTDAPIKVSQKTIDVIKAAGKEKSIGATKYKGVSDEYKEGVRRLYQSAAKPKPKAPAAKGGRGGKSSSAVM